jgi:hypothetical protein
MFLRTTRKRILAPALMGFLAARLYAQDSSQPVGEVAFSDLRVQSFSTDHVDFGAHVMIRTRQKVEVQRVSFSEVTLGRTPVFVAPLEQKFQVAPGQLTVLPGEIHITTYFRDVDPAAVEQILSGPTVKIQGTAVLDVDLNFFESVATLRRNITTLVPFGGDMPVTFPGGDLTREAALIAVRAATPLWAAAQQVAGKTGQVTGLSWSEQMLNQYSASLAYVLSKYQMRDKKGRVYAFNYSCVGFRISASEIVVPKEAIRPWEFDPRAILLAHESARLIADGDDVIVFPYGMAVQGPSDNPLNGLRLTLHDIRLAREGAADMEIGVVADGAKHKRANVHRRVSLKNFAVLELANPANPPAAASAAGALETGKTSWDRVAVFRATVAAAGGAIQFETISPRVHRDGSALVLDDPVDRSALGSPVVTSEGVIGMVQDERGGSVLRDALSANGYGAFAGRTNGGQLASDQPALAEFRTPTPETEGLNRSLF